METRCPRCGEAREVADVQGLTVEYAGHKGLPLVWCTVCGVVFVQVGGVKIAREE